MQSMLSLWWFEDQPPAAYSEGMSIGKVHDSPAVVERLQGVYDLALGDALSQKESRRPHEGDCEGIRTP
ncbi:Scr1 family TA system antitoxin-like transcriptional regulator [Streptomyces sp. SA15]|uniref:Scr1 family TA system antitoxin-like transcriptional regulator n=1 Tax=Streptomyces sp. SA15 TaxID=934019 RepID=UPI0015C9C129|nr:Scr1 family TA system antitoxin-like transcriptional regulator [Streptomyces sp. SA15]